jgi:hypothetical protein
MGTTHVITLDAAMVESSSASDEKLELTISMIEQALVKVK